MSHDEAMTIMAAEAGKAIDPDCLAALRSLHA
jgi:HD-GYP domain-containing protein (c-di-GMP phosphodiesterase class II)